MLCVIKLAIFIGDILSGPNQNLAFCLVVGLMICIPILFLSKLLNTHFISLWNILKQWLVSQWLWTDCFEKRNAEMIAKIEFNSLVPVLYLFMPLGFLSQEYDYVVIAGFTFWQIYLQIKMMCSVALVKLRTVNKRDKDYYFVSLALHVNCLCSMLNMSLVCFKPLYRLYIRKYL